MDALVYIPEKKHWLAMGGSSEGKLKSTGMLHQLLNRLQLGNSLSDACLFVPPSCLDDISEMLG
jgi:hypothetical protein